jgi:hypothetical protein
MRFHLIPTTFFCAALTLACGGGGSTTRPVAPTGNLTLRFGSDSLPGYSQAVVSLEKVEGSSDGSNWTSLGNVKATYDLMTLQNGHSVVILPSIAVTPATYTQFRITWATVNYQSAINQPAYVMPSGGSGQVLSMPVTTVVNGSVTVPNAGSATALIMLTGQQLVQSRAGGIYAFQAVGRALDLSASATITGHAGDGATPLSGVEVFAETVDGSGLATIQRRAITDAAGNFELDGLSTSLLYFVTAQPGASLTAYAAVAASPVNATATATYIANLAFSTPQTPGLMTVTITPASLSTQGTWGELRQTLTTGSAGSQVLIVRSQPVATGLTQDQVSFAGLAPGTYGVTVQRSTALAAPVMKTGTQVLVSAGGTATTTLTLP